MKVAIKLPNNLFDSGAINTTPETFTWQSSFPCTRPAGRVSLAFNIQHQNHGPRLVWDTQVTSKLHDVPDIPAQFGDWIDSAHNITHDWFFKLIEGDLEKQFDA